MHADEAAKRIRNTLLQQAGRVDEGMVMRGLHALRTTPPTSSGIDEVRAILTAALAQNTQGDGEAVAWDVVDEDGRVVAGRVDRSYADQVVRERWQDKLAVLPLYRHAERAQNTQGEASFWITRADLNRANSQGDNVVACPAVGDAPADAVLLYLHAERARAPEGWTMVPQLFVDKVRAAAHPDTHHRAVPLLIEEAMDELEDAAPSQPKDAGEVES